MNEASPSDTAPDGRAGTDRADAPPIDEPRGPHLPDRITAIPLPVWPFVALAVVVLLDAWRGLPSEAVLGLDDVVRAAIDVLPSLAATLLGAALLLRHPDARRTMPLVTYGAILFAVAEALQLATGAVAGLIEATTSPDDLVGSPLYTAYGTVTTIVGLFAVLYLAMGLGTARWFEDVPTAHRVRVGFAIAGIATAAVGVASTIALVVSADGSSLAIPRALQLAVSIGLGVGVILAWAYLAAVATTGRLAVERPVNGWAMAALAGGLMVVSNALGSLLSLLLLAIGMTDAPVTLYLLSGLAVASWVLLLAAFAVGLPSEVDPASSQA